MFDSEIGPCDKVVIFDGLNECGGDRVASGCVEELDGLGFLCYPHGERCGGVDRFGLRVWCGLGRSH